MKQNQSHQMKKIKRLVHSTIAAVPSLKHSCYPLFHIYTFLLNTLWHVFVVRGLKCINHIRCVHLILCSFQEGQTHHLSVSKYIYYLFFFESTKVFLVTWGNIKMGSLSASNPRFPFAHFRASCHCTFV